MPDPNLVISGLSRQVQTDGHTLKIDIYQLEYESVRGFEVVDQHGASTVRDDLFDSDHAAQDEALQVIEKKGADRQGVKTPTGNGVRQRGSATGSRSQHVDFPPIPNSNRVAAGG